MTAGLNGLFGQLGKGIGIVIARLREQGVKVSYLWVRDHLLRRVIGMSPADTSQVSPGLYVGGQHYRHGLKHMASLGISATVSMRQESDDVPRGVALARHLWLPTVDDTPPTLEQLSQAAEFIQDAIERGYGVYVHCASGIGRAPTAAASYLTSTGMPPTEAWETIRRARPFIRPKVKQVKQVELFHDSVRKHDYWCR